MPTPRSQMIAEEHRQHVAYHQSEAAEHEAHQETEAATRHRKAIEAHEQAATQPLDTRLHSTALRASAMAEEVSQRVRKARL